MAVSIKKSNAEEMLCHLEKMEEGLNDGNSAAMVCGCDGKPLGENRALVTRRVEDDDVEGGGAGDCFAAARVIIVANRRLVVAAKRDILSFGIIFRSSFQGKIKWEWGFLSFRIK